MISTIGQPAAYTSPIATETQAGFLQLAGYVSVDTVAPKITYADAGQGINQASPNLLSVSITDNIKPTSAELHYRPIASETFKSTAISGSDNDFSVTMGETWYDALGMEYYFTAADASGNTARSPESGSYYAYLTATSVIVPQLTAGAQTANYHIISMPYSSEGGDDIASAFGQASGLPQYAITRWRLATYDNSQDKFIEPSSGLTKFERGKGYWFITRAWPQGGLKLGQKTAPPNNRSSLYTLALKPGWNQIGNPYPLPIKWSDVQALAGNPSVGSVKIYEGGWADGDELLPFQGGFVKNDGSTDVVIKIPFSGQLSEGGRKSNTAMTADTDGPAWRISLHIFQGDQFNKIGAFGMSPASSLEVDSLDDYNPPRFTGSPELNFYHSGKPGLKFAKDMVPKAEKFVWRFTVDGTYGMASELRWGEDLSERGAELFLLDETSLQLVNMRKQSRYRFTLSRGHRFAIYLGDHIGDEIGTDQISVAGPIPNPVLNRSTSFNLGLPQEGKYEVQLEIMANTGVIVHADRQVFRAGIHHWQWNIDDRIIAGLYYYRILVESGGAAKLFTGKLLIP